MKSQVAVRKIKVLCYTDHDNGRDVEMLLPLRYFAERFLNCTFVHGFVYDEHAIFRYRPNIVLLPNIVGSPLYYSIAKYALAQGIPVFALDSEGNFRTDGKYDYWGYNLDKKILQDYLCLWSNRVVDFMHRELPEDRNRIVLTGATGFDRYAIHQFKNKRDFLEENGKTEYDRVIGYAGWAFGKLYYEKGRESLIAYLKGDEDKLVEIKAECELVYQILKQTIDQNQNTLFILKKHPTERRPTETGYSMNEMRDLIDRPNVIYEDENASIHDLISISDLWLSYESTTAIEAWMLGKTTIAVRPREDFMGQLPDKGLDKAQALAHNASMLQNCIDDYYREGQVPAFSSSDAKAAREHVVDQSIGFADGKNHIRAAFYLEKSIKNLNERKPRVRFNLSFFIRYLMIIAGVFLYLPKLYSRFRITRKFIWVFEQYRLKRLHESYKNYLNSFEAFYQQENIEEKYRGGKLYAELIPERNFEADNNKKKHGTEE